MSSSLKPKPRLVSRREKKLARLITRASLASSEGCSRKKPRLIQRWVLATDEPKNRA